jgi:transposase
MAYREVGMFDVKEVLRLWQQGKGKRWVAAAVGVDPKTVRSYVQAAEDAGVVREDPSTLTEERLVAVLAAVRPGQGRPHGEAWATCEAHREEIANHLAKEVRLSKVRRLLQRGGVTLPYATLHRFAVEELGFRQPTRTLPVADGKPGEELQVDTGWVLELEEANGRRRRLRAWIFTPGVSRYRFVWPVERETTESAIEACEAAWEFYGGVFRVLLPDNTKAIVAHADSLHPQLTALFLEYAQARGFVVDTARVRHPKDKARVERGVRDVRDDCFAGERLRTLEESRLRARHWSANEYGMRRHSRTGRMPQEHFGSVERAALLPAPAERYDVPHWCDPRVGPDQHAQVLNALYSLPSQYVGQELRARADRSTVRFYDGASICVKTHPRKPNGGRSTDAADFPPDRLAVASRDEGFLLKRAQEQGPSVARFAQALLDVPLPWTRMRRVYAVLDLCRRYGAARVEEACGRALAAEMTDVSRLARMIEQAAPTPEPAPAARVIPIARYLRPSSQYAVGSVTKPGEER